MATNVWKKNYILHRRRIGVDRRVTWDSNPRFQQASGRRPLWIFVCCECRVLSGRGLCDELITRPEESYRLCCVVVCDLETTRMGAPYIYDVSRLRVNFPANKVLKLST